MIVFSSTAVAIDGHFHSFFSDILQSFFQHGWSTFVCHCGLLLSSLLYVLRSLLIGIFIHLGANRVVAGRINSALGSRSLRSTFLLWPCSTPFAVAVDSHFHSFSSDILHSFFQLSWSTFVNHCGFLLHRRYSVFCGRYWLAFSFIGEQIGWSLVALDRWSLSTGRLTRNLRAGDFHVVA